MDTVPGQLDALARQIKAGDEQRLELVKRVDHVERAVAENTIITREMAGTVNEIRDVLVAGKVGTKLLRWAGAVALAVSALLVLGSQLLNGGKLPGP